MIKGIAYLRVSTELQDIDRQRKMIDDYSIKNNIKVVKWIQEKVSGSKSDRAGLLELMQCSDKDADIVIVADMSRFSRQDDLIKAVSNIATVLDNGLDLVFINKPDKIYKAYTQLSMSDTIMLIVEAYSSTVERTRIVERLTTQKEIMMQKNPYSFFCGEVHFGYKVIDNPDYDRKQIDGKVARKIIVEDPEKAQFVKELFKMYAEKKTIYEITKWLNNNNPEHNYWYNWVSRLLSNKVYKGERYYNKKTYHIKPLIEPELFNKVQILKKENRNKADNCQIEFNPFKGILFCGHCGAGLHQQRKSEANHHARTKFICNGKRSVNIYFKESQKCSSHNIAKQCVWDATLLLFMEEVGLDFDKHSKPAMKYLKADISNKEITLQSLQKQVSKNEKEMEKIAKTLLDCEIDSLKQRYKQQYVEAENSNKVLKKNIQEVNNEIAKISLKIDEMNKVSKTRCLTEKEITEQFKAYIDRITVYSAGSKRHFLVIHFMTGKEFIVLTRCFIRSTWCAKLNSDYRFDLQTNSCIRISDNKKFTFSELEDMAINRKMFSCGGSELVKGDY